MEKKRKQNQFLSTWMCVSGTQTVCCDAFSGLDSRFVGKIQLMEFEPPKFKSRESLNINM